MFITYQITHKQSKKFYIGKTTLADWQAGYMGSGKLIKRAVKKYGTEAFYKAILGSFEIETEAYTDEAMRVTQEEVDNPQCYNLVLGGCGYPAGASHPYWGLTGEDHPTYGMPGHWTGKKRPDLASKHTGKGNPMYGVTYVTSEQKKRDISNTMTGVKHTPDRIAKIWLGKQKKRMQILDNPVKSALKG